MARIKKLKDIRDYRKKTAHTTGVGKYTEDGMDFVSVNIGKRTSSISFKDHYVDFKTDLTKSCD